MDELKKLEDNLPSPPSNGAKISFLIFSDCRTLLTSLHKSKFAASYLSAGKQIVENSEEFRQNFRYLFGRPDFVVDLAVHWVPGMTRASRYTSRLIILQGKPKKGKEREEKEKALKKEKGEGEENKKQKDEKEENEKVKGERNLKDTEKDWDDEKDSDDEKDDEKGNREEKQKNNEKNNDENDEKEKKKQEEKQRETQEQPTWPIASFYTRSPTEEERRRYISDEMDERANLPERFSGQSSKPVKDQWLRQVQQNSDPFFWDQQLGFGHPLTGYWRWDHTSYHYVWEWDKGLYFDPQRHRSLYQNGWAWHNSYQWPQ
ncbi:hypothetical protein SMACR_09480 [Sordaria macrospora]|uniref:WGS project CABT00000000 data, contig 2.94 n=2 Tax=Sordaria macrospora TaxID=5147 RepID=F7WC32_SORMK|nr:uncharacterized protein SMAC_09480 [Sordaria macrospora k-hell]KAA8624127.1 hypothetical protein SMACR_09480 [Sordaria macrospora]WPJ67320.1 hypothetical protein SMAC4_09480 [Sordaria macrospora]CCC05535.1 unnamed protein product [Sordaria macrospora k-hell]